MRALLTPALLALLCCGLTPAAEQDAPLPQPQQTPEAQPATHLDVALALLELMRHTNSCLAGCTDEASVQAALPTLRTLAAQAQRLKDIQNNLPDPSEQDFLVTQGLLRDFYPLWKSIREHYIRLEDARLMSDELRSVLRLAPRPQPEG